MNYIDYITQSMEKGTLGSTISVGIFAAVGIFGILGLLCGLSRGFSKSVIRFFTVILSACGALYAVTAACNVIVNLTNKEGLESVDKIIESYAPGTLDTLPEFIRPILTEMKSETAVIFLMMVVCVLVTPVLFIVFFYLLKALTFLVYKLLSGLVGAVSYDKGITSTVCGGAVGLVQGILTAGILLIPISGLCGVLETVKEPLIDNNDAPDQQIIEFYDNIVYDIADNPLFDTIDKFGGATAYEKMITVTISGEKMDMSSECEGILKLISDAMPFVNEDFNWADPTDSQKQALNLMVVDIGNNELISSLVSDIMRGVAACVENGSYAIPLEGTNRDLVEDALDIFHTSTKDNIENDLDMIVDIYLIMCDHDLLTAFENGNDDELKDALTKKDGDGKTVIDLIINRLNEDERGAPIIDSLTKISLALLQGTLGTDEDMAQLYEDVKQEINGVLSHNKADFETEEEYKATVKTDLEKVFEENNLRVEEDIKDSMVDYIADNYGDSTEITDKEINDAILSYYNSYASYQESLKGQGGSGSASTEE